MLGVYLGLGDAGVPVQLAVVPVGPAVAATHPVLFGLTLLQRKTRFNQQKESATYGDNLLTF